MSEKEFVKRVAAKWEKQRKINLAASKIEANHLWSGEPFAYHSYPPIWELTQFELPTSTLYTYGKA